MLKSRFVWPTKAAMHAWPMRSVTRPQVCEPRCTALQAISDRVQMNNLFGDSWFGGGRGQDQSTGWASPGRWQYRTLTLHLLMRNIVKNEMNSSSQPSLALRKWPPRMVGAGRNIVGASPPFSRPPVRYRETGTPAERAEPWVWTGLTLAECQRWHAMR